MKTDSMQNNQDKHLDVPSEANREKHINFLDAEEKAGSGKNSDGQRSGGTREDEERRKQWQQGLEEGRKSAPQNENP